MSWKAYTNHYRIGLSQKDHLKCPLTTRKGTELHHTNNQQLCTMRPDSTPELREISSKPV